jgi:hypothetical protein
MCTQKIQRILNFAKASVQFSYLFSSTRDSAVAVDTKYSYSLIHAVIRITFVAVIKLLISHIVVA